MNSVQVETELAELRLYKNVPYYNEQRADSIYKILKKNRVNRVLDVGCGLGKVSIYLAQHGMDVIGLDISERLINLAKVHAKEKNVKIEFILSSLVDFHPKEKFDAVLFAGVLEHIENDDEMIKESKRLIKKQGKIVITDKPIFFTKRDILIGHLRRYTKKSLKEKLLNAGFSDINLKYYNFLMLFGNLYLYVTRKEEYPYESLNPALNKCIYWWYKYLENNYLFPFGARITAVGTVRN